LLIKIKTLILGHVWFYSKKLVVVLLTVIDEYILGFPKKVQAKLKKMRAVIKSAAPLAEEKMAYGIPTFFLNENLVHFAGYEKHIGFYPTPSAIIEFKKELTEYKITKGTIQFPLGKPIPFDLIKRITKWRVKQVE
jgi:uncharacterized protein YdhG (YjbR/CyaY superfamily)